MAWTFTPITFLAGILLLFIWGSTFAFFRRLDRTLIESQEDEGLEVGDEKPDFEKEFE
jgi:hypothetical protein